MTHVSMVAADEVYRVASKSAIAAISAESDEIQAFDEQYLALMRSLGDARTDAYWTNGLAWLRRARFNVLATPLPTTHTALGLLAAVAHTREAFAACDRIYPQHTETVGGLCNAAMAVLLADADPLSDAIADAAAGLGEAKRVGLVLPHFGFDDLAARHLRSRPEHLRIDVVSSSELQLRRPYEALFVIGRIGWYLKRGTGWIFTAPRANEIVLTSYAWTFDRPPSSRAFFRSRVAPQSLALEHLELPRSGELTHENEIEIDWELLSRELVERTFGSTDTKDLAEARLLMLADGRAAFVGWYEDARVQVLDPDEPSGSRIDWVVTTEIAPGAFVLLRSEGGGDLIVSVADSLLGQAAPQLRRMQGEWKRRLADQIELLGIDGVTRALRSLGSSRANRGNVLHWVSPSSLRTADEADFFAVIDFVGLTGQERVYWNAMGKLHHAHRRAGFRIRDGLEKEAERANLIELQIKGALDFTLPDGGGALTAFRVEDISPQTFTVPYQQLGEPMRARV